VCEFEIVGLEDVFQQNPLAVTVPFPAEVTFDEAVTLVVFIFEIVGFETVGTTTLDIVVNET
jgi:hypothetical protein